MTTKPKNRILTGCLGIAGILCLVIGIAIAVFGIAYGYTEDKEFYARQDRYHAQDDEREAMNERYYALQAERDSLVEVGDTVQAAVIDARIDSITNSSEYEDLFGIPEPPKGFSMAYLVTIFLIIIALPFIVAGVGGILIWNKRRRESERV